MLYYHVWTFGVIPNSAYYYSFNIIIYNIIYFDCDRHRQLIFYRYDTVILTNIGIYMLKSTKSIGLRHVKPRSIYFIHNCTVIYVAIYIGLI